MTSIVILGAGKIGAAIAQLLGDAGDYTITIADSSPERLDRISIKNLEKASVDAHNLQSLKTLLDGRDIVISALPFFLNVAVAEIAAKLGLHYFDLTEDITTTRKIKKIAKSAKSVMMPQCGLAPGFVGIVARELARTFDELETVRMRVGALPQFPTNALKYNLTWSTDGLINEYCNPCEAIVEGAQREVLPLEGYEEFALDGVRYEAFNTSGGLGTLCETLEGRVYNLDYKTVRYPGHRDLIKMLVDDLRLSNRRDLLKDVLETAIPMTLQDVVLVFVTISGIKNGRLTQESFARKIYGKEISGKLWSAIQVTTAAGACGAIDLVVNGTLPGRGFVRQEDIALDDLLDGRFGQYWSQETKG